MKQLNWYQIFGKSNIPDGRTVLPTDDIQIWLNCANIWDKTYTTLAEVLADTDTLLALITSNNAVDYMVRSTTWAESIALVPKMTSNTTPSGVCFGYNTYPSLQPYYSFNQDYSNNWASSRDAYGYVGYIFDTPKAIGQISMDSYYLYACVIEGSNDTTTGLDGTWEQIGEELSITTYGYDSDVHSDKAVFNGNSYKAYRLYITSGKGGSASRGAIRILQFHTPSIVNNATAMTYIGQNNYASNTLLADATWCNAICNSEYFESVLNVKVPTMTSNTTPSGEVISSDYNPTIAYRSFSGLTSGDSFYYIPQANVTGYLGYVFEEDVRIVYATTTVTQGRASFFIQDGSIEVSTDNVTFTSVLTFHNSDRQDLKKYNYIFTNSSPHRSIRFYGSSGGSWLVFGQSVQFYGRKDI